MTYAHRPLPPNTHIQTIRTHRKRPIHHHPISRNISGLYSLYVCIGGWECLLGGRSQGTPWGVATRVNSAVSAGYLPTLPKGVMSTYQAYANLKEQHHG